MDDFLLGIRREILPSDPNGIKLVFSFYEPMTYEVFVLALSSGDMASDVVCAHAVHIDMAGGD